MATAADALVVCVDESMDEIADHAFERRAVSRAPEVAHSPDGRPQTDDVVDSRKHDGRLDQASSEAEFVPAITTDLSPDQNGSRKHTHHVETSPFGVISLCVGRCVLCLSTSLLTSLVVQIMRLLL